ncbi:hypothetical protein MKX01_019476 [Papaver californicum]|nr:hypothetical protein MKX01_019476 [Papaver californicum]
MKIRSSGKKMCEFSNPKHKQRQGMSTFAYDGALPPISCSSDFSSSSSNLLYNQQI